MVGQRPGPSLALVQKCCWLELVQSCCRVHLEWRDTGQDPGVSPRRSLPALPMLGASPCLQGAPATVGVGRPHALLTGSMRGARSDFHPGHLKAEAGAQLSEAAGPSPRDPAWPARAKRGWRNRLGTIKGETRKQGFSAQVTSVLRGEG